MTTKNKETSKKYSKEMLLKSKELNVNVLSVVLEDEKEYTLEEAKKLTEEFMNKEVK